jgi:hypothetical protein
MTNQLSTLKFCDEAERLVELWRAMPRDIDTLCPDKAHFSPMDMRQHLCSVMLYEKHSNDKIIVRVAGTRMETYLGHDLTGKNIFDVFPPEHMRAYDTYFKELVRNPCAGMVERPIRGSGGHAQLIKSLHLPMTDKTGEIRYLIGVVKSFALPKHFTDYRSAAMTASRNITIRYYDIGGGTPGDDTTGDNEAAFARDAHVQRA